ncbi:hypothetical protein N8930_00825 [Euryarchaeota archaeon]|nr:hypothetical protein [Euryarchaeota archaeon]MDA7740302.1 hypothetical protein [Euryarchaeota archaeon]
MAHRPIVHLRGEPSSLMFGLVERLLRSATDLVLDTPLHDMVVVRYANDLAFGEAAIFTPEAKPLSFGHRVVMVGFGPFTTEDDGQGGLDVDGVELILVTPAEHIAEVSFDWVDAHVEVHDLIPMHSGGGWMPPVLTRWFEALVAGQATELLAGPEHWWVGEVDVADALGRLLISEQAFPEICKMSGRRSWGEDQTLEEFQMLYRRTSAGQSGSFGIEELTAAPTPKIELQTLMVSDSLPLTVEANRHQRPDLSAIHDALHAADGDGWRPLVPVRTALMHCLARMLEISR